MPKCRRGLCPLAGLSAIYHAFAAVLGHLRQRVQLDAFIERRSCYLVEVVAKGFVPRHQTLYPALIHLAPLTGPSGDEPDIVNGNFVKTTFLCNFIKDLLELFANVNASRRFRIEHV